jgi:hypothetical protein
MVGPTTIQRIRQSMSAENVKSAAVNTLRGVGQFFGVAGGQENMDRWREQYNNRVAPQQNRLGNAFGMSLVVHRGKRWRG